VRSIQCRSAKPDSRRRANCSFTITECCERVMRSAWEFILGRFTHSATAAKWNRYPAASTGLPRGVICLISALAYHGLTTEIPHSVDVALPGHAQIPKLGGIPLRAFWYSEPSFSAGVQTVSIDGVDVRIYSPEKSIADCFKYRNKIGLDLAIQALRTYRERSKKPDLKLISKFAALNRVEKVMRPYLEAVL
jgi:predicted transcriptional regulator of viral defense system